MLNEKTILIVDDEPMTRLGLKKTIETWANGKYETMCVESAVEAMEVIKRQKIHVLITDIRMPEISGLHLLETLRKNGYNPVVIILSGYSEFGYAQQAIELGVINYLLKPVNKRKLIEAVEKALEIQENQKRVELIEKVVDTKLLNVRNENIDQISPVKQVLHFIEENLGGQLSLSIAANHVHLNPCYLSAVFKEQTNVTFSEYVTRRRIENAKNLLVSTNCTVDEIAHKVGYQTGKYFIKLFKDYEGVTPSQFRKSNYDMQF